MINRASILTRFHVAPSQTFNRRNPKSHALPCGRVRGVHEDARGNETSKCHGLFNPDDDVVASATSIVPEVVIEAHFRHLPGFEQRDHFLRPARFVQPSGVGRSSSRKTLMVFLPS